MARAQARLRTSRLETRVLVRGLAFFEYLPRVISCRHSLLVPNVNHSPPNLGLHIFRSRPRPGKARNPLFSVVSHYTNSLRTTFRPFEGGLCRPHLPPLSPALFPSRIRNSSPLSVPLRLVRRLMGPCCSGHFQFVGLRCIPVCGRIDRHAPRQFRCRPLHWPSLTFFGQGVPAAVSWATFVKNPPSYYSLWP